eukprot:5674718-Lingulodinium_polyedra.AAC.1
MRPSSSCCRPPWRTQGSCAAGCRWLRTGCGRGTSRARAALVESVPAQPGGGAHPSPDPRPPYARPR